MFNLQMKLYRIFDRNSSVRIKFDFMVLYRSLGIRFETGLGISMTCRFLGGVSKNQDPLKGTWRLPCVRLSGRGVIEAFLDFTTISST